MQESLLAIEETMTKSPILDQDKEHAWQDLLAFRDKVFCLCLGFAGNASDARDLTQDTFAKVLVHYSRVRPENPQAWILRIARNTCLDLLRRKKARGPQHPVSDFSAVDLRTPEINASQAEEIRIVRKAIASLPRRQRDVLVMREYGELSYQEIGLAFQLSLGTVMSRLRRLRGKPNR